MTACTIFGAHNVGTAAPRIEGAEPVPNDHQAQSTKDAAPATPAAQERVLAELPFADTSDFEEARRGVIAALPGGIIHKASGELAWDLGQYDFLGSETAPPTVNPSLWRMARLNMANGLFQVTDRVCQIRGLELANMTIVESETGIVVIDTLGCAAAAALAPYRAYRGRRRVRAIIYTHSRSDHYGGALGVATAEEVERDGIAIIAPDQFMESPGAETVLAGVPMMRRMHYQFGIGLPSGPCGQVDSGLCKRVASGTSTLLAPTELIIESFETRTLDAVDFVFQMAPDTEAPAEMHIFLPQFGVLNMAENTTRHLHNFIPIRGAVARDTRVWSKYIARAMEAFGDRIEILIAQHHWPVWAGNGCWPISDGSATSTSTSTTRPCASRRTASGPSTSPNG